MQPVPGPLGSNSVLASSLMSPAFTAHLLCCLCFGNMTNINFILTMSNYQIRLQHCSGWENERPDSMILILPVSQFQVYWHFLIWPVQCMCSGLDCRHLYYEELFLYTHTHIYMLLGEILPNQINKGDRVWELLSQMILGLELWAVLFEWYHNSVFLHLTTWYMPLEIFNLKTVQYRIPWWKVYSAYIEWTGIIDCGLSFPGLFYA